MQIPCMKIGFHSMADLWETVIREEISLWEKEKQILMNPKDAPVSAQEYSGFQVKTHFENFELVL